jgi:predicted CXXCH cytochrome family protein
MKNAKTAEKRANSRAAIALTALMAVLAVMLLWAPQAFSIVSGGKHDLTIAGGGSFFAVYPTEQTCSFCHTPHGANRTKSYVLDPGVSGFENATINGAYLWNRKIPQNTFNVYQTTATLDHTIGQPGVLSLMCLSCHDGVGAMNVLLNMPAGEYIPTDISPEGYFAVPPGELNQFGDAGSDFAFNKEVVRLNIGEAVCDGSGDSTTCSSGGTNLSNDHPIGFVYNGNSDAGLYALESIQEEAIKNRLKYVTGGRMECSVCHDPHMTNEFLVDDNFFLVVDNTGSRLCLACHDK